MKRLLFFAGLLLALSLPASATLVSLPNNFVNGSVIDAGQVMANYNAITAVVNGNIDHANTTGSSGFYASDIKPPTSLAATFGGTSPYTFPNGIIMSALTASLPLCLDVNKALSTTCSSGAVTSVTASAPLASSGGATPNISLTGVIGFANGGTNASSIAAGPVYSTGTAIAPLTITAPLQYSAGALSCSTCVTANRVKLAIGLGFNQGAVSTATVFPTQPVVGYTNGQITGIRAACSTVDNGTTVVALKKNGSVIGTSLTLGTGVVSSNSFTGVSIGAGDYLDFNITTAGTAANCGFIAEGQQVTY